MRSDRPEAGAPAAGRDETLDVARGWCIALVVMMHSTLGVGEELGGEGFLHRVVAFAQPFRIPAFFLVAGLFAGPALSKPLRTFVDRKILHFVYFYGLWAGVQIFLKDFAAQGWSLSSFGEAAALALVQPYGPLWFIYVLPFFYVTARLLRGRDRRLGLALALALYFARPNTGWVAVDEYAGRFLFFYLGCFFAAPIRAFPGFARAHAGAAALLLAVWAGGEILLTQTAAGQALTATRPGALAEALAGAAALLAISALMAGGGLDPAREKPALSPARTDGGARRPGAFGEGKFVERVLAPAFSLLGRRSLTIYVAFFLPMVLARVALARLAPGMDIGLASLIVFAVALVAPLFMERAARALRLSWLFERPGWARLRT